jgi:hypothetical protein
LEGRPNGVSLREYIERIFDERQKALDLAFRSQQEALALASRTLELRLEKLNELRQEVTQDRGNYVTKDKFDTTIDVQERRFRLLEDARNRAIGFGAALGLLGGLAGGIVIRLVAGH